MFKKIKFQRKIHQFRKKFTQKQKKNTPCYFCLTYHMDAHVGSVWQFTIWVQGYYDKAKSSWAVVV
jgi:hypothetical protein